MNRFECSQRITEIRCASQALRLWLEELANPKIERKKGRTQFSPFQVTNLRKLARYSLSYCAPKHRV